jgi:hypothetical protein
VGAAVGVAAGAQAVNNIAAMITSETTNQILFAVIFSSPFYGYLEAMVRTKIQNRTAIIFR